MVDLFSGLMCRAPIRNAAVGALLLLARAQTGPMQRRCYHLDRATVQSATAAFHGDHTELTAMPPRAPQRPVDTAGTFVITLLHELPREAFGYAV